MVGCEPTFDAFPSWYDKPYVEGEATAQLNNAVAASIREMSKLGARP